VHKEKRMFSRRDSNIKGFKKSTKNLLRLFWQYLSLFRHAATVQLKYID
jgi:hypothetical protein